MEALMKAMSTCLLDMDKNVATRQKEKGLLSKSNAELPGSARWYGAKSTRAGDSLLKLFLQYTWCLQSTLGTKLRSIFATKFMRLFWLLLKFKGDDGSEVRTYYDLDCREITKLFLLRVICSTCVLRTLSKRPLSQALSRDCKRSGNMRMVKYNGLGCFKRRNPSLILCASCRQTNPERVRKPSSRKLQ